MTESPDAGTAYTPSTAIYKHSDIIAKLKEDIEARAGRFTMGYTLANMPFDFIKTEPHYTAKPEEIKSWALQKGIDKLPRHLQAMQEWNDDIRDEVAKFLDATYKPQIGNWLANFSKERHSEREFDLKEALLRLAEKPS